ncbi:hypothetical protein TNCV_1714701 [Trichonephila clavipes]|nr:hypothetical protein TNCV_1714701 [Trichonephila clavipes]
MRASDLCLQHLGNGYLWMWCSYDLDRRMAQGPYADIEFKQVTCVILGASRRRCIRHDAACRNGTRLKKLRCAPPASSFVNSIINAATRRYAAVSRKWKQLPPPWKQLVLLQVPSLLNSRLNVRDMDV